MMRMKRRARSKLASRRIAACFILYNLSVWDKIRDKICCTPATSQEVKRLHQTRGYHTLKSKDQMKQTILKFNTYLITPGLRKEQYFTFLLFFFKYDRRVITSCGWQSGLKNSSHVCRPRWLTTLSRHWLRGIQYKQSQGTSSDAFPPHRKVKPLESGSNASRVWVNSGIWGHCVKHLLDLLWQKCFDTTHIV